MTLTKRFDQIGLTNETKEIHNHELAKALYDVLPRTGGCSHCFRPMTEDEMAARLIVHQLILSQKDVGQTVRDLLGTELYINYNTGFKFQLGVEGKQITYMPIFFRKTQRFGL